MRAFIYLGGVSEQDLGREKKVRKSGLDEERAELVGSGPVGSSHRVCPYR